MRTKTKPTERQRQLARTMAPGERSGASSAPSLQALLSPGAAAVHLTAPGVVAGTVTMEPIDELVVEEEVGCRARLYESWALRFRDRYRAEGAQAYPALEVYVDELGVKRVVSGRYRRWGGELAGLTALPCVVKPGSKRDAILAASGKNDDHGLPRSDLDRTLAALRFELDAEWSAWSATKIAGHARLSVTFVCHVRKVVPLLLAGLPKEKVLEREDVAPGLIDNVLFLLRGGAPSLHGAEMAGAAPALAVGAPATHVLPAAATVAPGAVEPVDAAAGAVAAPVRTLTATRGGKTYQVKTANIGGAQRERKKKRQAAEAAVLPKKNAAEEAALAALRRGPDAATRDPSLIIDLRALGRAWALKAGKQRKTDPAELREQLGEVFATELACVKLGAFLAHGQAGEIRERALHLLVEGASDV